MLTALGCFMTAVGLFLLLWYRTVVGLPESTRPAGIHHIHFKWGVPSLGVMLILLGILSLAWDSLWYALGGLAGTAMLAFLLIRFDRYTATMRIIFDRYKKFSGMNPNMEEMELLYHTARWRYPDWTHDRLVELVAGKDIESLILLMLLNENKINPITDWELYRSLRLRAADITKSLN
jgi:hypothetical protein